MWAKNRKPKVENLTNKFDFEIIKCFKNYLQSLSRATEVITVKYVGYIFS